MLTKQLASIAVWMISSQRRTHIGREGHEIKILLSTPDFNAMGITEWPKTKIFQFCSKNPSGNHTWVYRT